MPRSSSTRPGDRGGRGRVPPGDCAPARRRRARRQRGLGEPAELGQADRVPREGLGTYPPEIRRGLTVYHCLRGHKLSAKRTVRSLASRRAGPRPRARKDCKDQPPREQTRKAVPRGQTRAPTEDRRVPR